MTTAYTHLISVAQLQQLQAQGAPLMVFDCSFNLFDPAEADTHFAQAHIAGSRQAHLERDLSAASGAPASVAPALTPKILSKTATRRRVRRRIRVAYRCRYVHINAYVAGRQNAVRVRNYL